MSLILGHAEALVDEVEFGASAVGGFSPSRYRSVLAELARGGSPHIAVGHYDFSVAGRRARILLDHEVMPPGADTPAVLREIEAFCPTVSGRWVLDIGCGSGILGDNRHPFSGLS